MHVSTAPYDGDNAWSTPIEKTFMVKDGSVINFNCTFIGWNTCREIATELQSQQCHCSRREKYTLQQFTKRNWLNNDIALADVDPGIRSPTQKIYGQ